MQITLNEIKEKSPCQSGWEILLKSFNKTKADDTVVSIAHLLESNGIKDTLWVINCCIEGEVMGVLQKKHNMYADFAEPAIIAAEGLLHIFENKYPNDNRPRKAIENAKENVRRAREGLKRLPRATAADAAYAAYAAAATAADAADAAADAAYAAYAAAATAADAAYAAAAAADADAYAADADAYAAAAAARQKARDNQKLIILKHFGEEV